MVSRSNAPSAQIAELSPSEQRLLACAAEGTWWYPDAEHSSGLYENPLEASTWPEAMQIRAEVIRALAAGLPLQDGQAPKPLHAHGLKIANAAIIGDLDFDGCEISTNLWLQGCGLLGTLRLVDAKTRSVILNGSFVPGIVALRARVEGDFSLRDTFETNHQIVLTDVKISGELNCNGSKFSADEPICINGNSAQIGSGVFFGDGFAANGSVDLTSAELSGSLNCCGGTFDGRGETAMNLMFASIKGSVLIGKSDDTGTAFVAKGNLNFIGASIGQFLLWQDGSVSHHGGVAFSGYQLSVGMDVWLIDVNAVDGIVSFDTAHIGGSFKLYRCAFAALDLNNAIIAGSLLCRGCKFLTSGPPAYRQDQGDSARTAVHHGWQSPVGEPQINCFGLARKWSALGRAAHARSMEDEEDANHDGEATTKTSERAEDNDTIAVALNGNSLSVGGDVSLFDEFQADGLVLFIDAKIGSNFSCNNATFRGAQGLALFCMSMSVGMDIMLGNGFRAQGEVSFVAVSVKSHLSCDDAEFENPGVKALDCDAISVGADVFLRGKFRAKGNVNFIRAEVRGNFSCEGGTFENQGGTALTLDFAHIGAGLRLINVASLDGTLDLDQATVHTIYDDGSAWPQLKSKAERQNQGYIWLDGLTYEQFSGTDTNWRKRLEWLRRQPPQHLKQDYRPQPWAQLVRVLREMGHEEDARRIAIERERLVSYLPRTTFASRIWRWFLGITIGYGYRPAIALRWSAAILLVGWFTFAYADQRGYMAPRDGSVIAYIADHAGATPNRYPRIHPVVYSFDVFLPVIELGQDQAWAPAFQDDKKPKLSEIERGSAEALAVQTACTVAMPPDVSRASLMAIPKRIGDCAGTFGKALGRVGSTKGAVLFELGVHRFIYWLEEFLGWVFVSLYIAGMSGLVKRE